MKSKKLGISLLSGGLDSSIATAIAHQGECEIILAITVDYGQHAAKSELEHAEKVAQYLEIPNKRIVLPWFREFHENGLIDSPKVIPKPNLFELNDRKKSLENARHVWVPNRNGVFIEIAAAFAEALKAECVVTGFNREEASAFPDNSLEYLSAINQALMYSTATGVQVISPTATLDKTEIIRKGREIRFPFELLWSCYLSGHTMCGQCESCQRLKVAFRANEISYDELFEYPELH